MCSSDLAASCLLEVEPFVGGRKRVHIGGRNREVVDEGIASLLIVAVGMASSDPALIAPPQVHATPIECVSIGVFRHGFEHLDAHTATGQHHVCVRAFSEHCGHSGVEPVCCRCCQGLSVVMNEHAAVVGHDGGAFLVERARQTR